MGSDKLLIGVQVQKSMEENKSNSYNNCNYKLIYTAICRTHNYLHLLGSNIVLL